MKLNKIRNYLRDIKNRDTSENVVQGIFDSLFNEKAILVEKDDQRSAKEIWCLEQVLYIQQGYLNAFKLLKSGNYFNAWKEFENIEIKLQFLAPHMDINSDEYYLLFIKNHIKRYQSLYPYKIFMSPEILEHEKVCSVCNKRISIRNPCGHEVGEIYNGEMCYRIVTKCDVLGISFVESPLQKYSVPFLTDGKTEELKDHYNYKLIENLVKELKSPFDDWDVEIKQVIHPHETFADIGRNDKCPCGSGEKYKKCCLLKDGVTMPHYEFILPYEVSDAFKKTIFI